jgi:dimeric dUTPase (all-alpha-NTP-PPase superfamily)
MWSNMKATQEILDSRVIETHDLEMEELFEERILALTDEVMEYAKATKCFKYWSLKDPDPTYVRLEEFVDGIHFYLSFFNYYEITPEQIKAAEILTAEIKGLSLKEGITYHITRALQHLMILLHPLSDDKGKSEQLRLSFAHFWAAGILDGFDHHSIELAYYAKNKKNHERQSSGY